VILCANYKVMYCAVCVQMYSEDGSSLSMVNTLHFSSIILIISGVVFPSSDFGAWLLISKPGVEYVCSICKFAQTMVVNINVSIFCPPAVHVTCKP